MKHVAKLVYGHKYPQCLFLSLTFITVVISFKMHISLLTTLSLLRLSQAGQDLNLGGTASENEVLLDLSPELRDHVHSPESSNQEPSTPETISTPWTEQVKCIPKENSTAAYCVYSNDEFANNRGISFFTTPSIADKIAALPAFSKKNIYNSVNKFNDAPWEIRSMHGRGKGLFATRTLYRGDQIVAATPIGVYHTDALPPDYELEYIYLHTAFIQLPKATQQIFLSTMAGSEGDPIMERVNTNAFFGDFEGSPHFLMYPETAVSVSYL